MKLVLIVLVFAGALSLETDCGPGGAMIPGPGSFNSTECLTVEQMESMKKERQQEPDVVLRLILWTQATKAGSHEELAYNNLKALQSTSFDHRLPTRFLIHGWLNDWTADSVEGLAKAYVGHGAYNVIGVDWSDGSSTLLYYEARARVENVARSVANQIKVLFQAGQKPSQIVLIGHSLGAHVAGFTGKHFQTPPKLAAIIALDPAGPLFGPLFAPLYGEYDTDSRVDRDDAEYVEVIHTNVDLLGYGDPIGQADFFPNRGHNQPGCSTHTCDHVQAVKYFHESLVTTGPVYVGHRCETDSIHSKCDGMAAVMGSDPDETFKVKTKGVFYVAVPK